MSFKILGTGDAMLLEKLPKRYDFEEISDCIKKANIKISNLEMVPVNNSAFASTFCGGQWIHTDVDNVKELMCYGFDVLACANNHSMDFSYDGIIQTCEFLENNNIPYSGIGRSLDDASKAVYCELEDESGISKTVAIISVTTTFLDPARAGNANEFFSARPGVNALRRKEVYYVSKEQMKALKQISADTFINGERDNARKIGSLPQEKEGTFNFGGIFFEENEKKGKYTYCDSRDLERILQEIRRAKNKADYVVVVGHSHQIKHDKYTEPDYFFEEFCHACIDEGACCIIGGGTHQLKPIEFYKGRPILYSLGNFIFQLDKVKKLPDEFWDKYNYNRAWSVEECLRVKSKNGTVGLELDINNYYSVLAFIEIECSGETIVKLLPIVLNFDNNDLKGLPRLATKDEANAIAVQLKSISKYYNTEFKLKIGDDGITMIYCHQE